jgi:hypothetical protein
LTSSEVADRSVSVSVSVAIPIAPKTPHAMFSLALEDGICSPSVLQSKIVASVIRNKKHSGAAMKTPPTDQRPRKQPSKRTLTILTWLVAIATLGAGVGWLVYSYYVDLEVPYFAIPLVLCVPVIVAVAFRNMWD